MTTIKDVARRAQVSMKTVSRVVNDEPAVRANTRERVLKAINELRYLPNNSARGLREGRAYAVGLVYDNPNPHYIISVQQGVQAACAHAGFGLQIHPCKSTAPTLADDLTDLARRWQLAGLVLAPPMSENAEVLRALKASDIPLVRIISADRDPEDDYPCVYVDDRDAAYSITEHLVQLGHTRIGFLSGGAGHRSSPERYQGYEDALRDYGIAPDKTLIVAGDFSFDDGFRGARKLFALKNRPTAVFGCNDEIAAGVLAAARAAGLNVPYDLSIAGFEDSPISRQSWPALTTARQDTDAIASHAARLLIALIRDNVEHIGNEGFKPELVVRGSTAPPRIRTNDMASALPG